MQKFTKILGLVLLITMLGVFPVYAAESPLTMTSAEINVMPEYDTEDVLVIFALNYVNNSAQPYSGEIRFSVPKDIKSNIVTENMHTSEDHLNVRVENKGEFSELVWTPTKPIEPKAAYPIHLEYYNNPLPGTGSKSFVYQFNAPIEVQKANVIVLQPLKATDFKIEPAANLMGKSNEGFNIYGFERSGLKPGDQIKFAVSYKKDDPNPSVKPPGQNQGSQGQPGQSESSQLATTTVIIPLVFLAAFIIFLVFRSKGQKGPSVRESVVPEMRRERSTPGNSKVSQEKQKIREMLLNGDISEDTYLMLVRDIEGER